MDLLIRNVPAKTLEKLKRRAKRRGTSVQVEALGIIEAGARYSGEDFLEEVARLRAGGKLSFDVSAALEALHEDRTR